MIKIKFLDNNIFLVRFNADISLFNVYINIITTVLLNYAKPNLNKEAGWLFKYKHLNKVLTAFNNDVIYENKYVEPPYSNIGSMMKLKPFDYQKEFINFILEKQKALLIAPCGAGKCVY